MVKHTLTPRALGCLFGLWITACHTPAPSLPLESWTSPVGSGHPLAGKIYDARTGAFIDSATLRQRLGQSDLILVGEKHDNPDHQRIQAAVIQALTRAGNRPALVTETISHDQQPQVDSVLQQGGNAEELATQLAWEKSGWPSFDHYRPVFEAALTAGLPVFGGNLSKTEVNDLLRGAKTTTTSAEAKLTAEALPVMANKRLAEQLNASHCGHAPPAMLAAMARVQRARDARMATTLAPHALKGGAVLLGGLGHVRRDFGVPWYIERLAPEAKVLVVAAIEIDPGRQDPAAYLSHASQPVFDLVYFTPRVDSEDPCVRFRRQLERLKASRLESHHPYHSRTPRCPNQTECPARKRASKGERCPFSPPPETIEL